jgi:hypothetical protein
MSVATILSREQRGIDAPQVRVEVDIGSGLPAFNIVGLPEAVVKERDGTVGSEARHNSRDISAGTSPNRSEYPVSPKNACGFMLFFVCDAKGAPA